MLSPGLNAPIKLSYTAVDQYLRCPRCFYLRHVLHLKPLPGAAQIVGIAVHEAMELFYKQWREADVGEGAKPTRARLIELGRQAFASNWPRQTEVDRKQLDQVVSQLGVAFDRLVSTQGEDAQVLELHRNGLLGLIHLHWMSMRNMHPLLEWHVERAAAQIAT